MRETTDQATVCNLNDFAFIVGTPRSGTTLAQSIVACNSKIWTCPETHFLTGTLKYPFVGIPIPFRSSRQIATMFAEIIQPKERKKIAPELGFFSASLIDAALPCEVQKYFRLLEILAERSDCMILEKTPSHLHSIDLLKRSATNRSIRFIHIIRTYEQNASSLISASRAWGKPLSERAVRRYYLRDLRLHLKYIGDPSHIYFDYDTIVGAPELFYRHTCGFLEIPFCETDLVRRTEAAAGIVLETEPWKSRNSEEIAKGSRQYSALRAPLLSKPDLAAYDHLLTVVKRYFDAEE
jgi:hypothetical protein